MDVNHVMLISLLFFFSSLFGSQTMVSSPFTMVDAVPYSFMHIFAILWLPMRSHSYVLAPQRNRSNSSLAGGYRLLSQQSFIDDSGHKGSRERRWAYVTTAVPSVDTCTMYCQDACRKVLAEIPVDDLLRMPSGIDVTSRQTDSRNVPDANHEVILQWMICVSIGSSPMKTLLPENATCSTHAVSYNKVFDPKTRLKRNEVGQHMSDIRQLNE